MLRGGTEKRDRKREKELHHPEAHQIWTVLKTSISPFGTPRREFHREAFRVCFSFLSFRERMWTDSAQVGTSDQQLTSQKVFLYLSPLGDSISEFLLRKGTKQKT
jgi:hypothetical protein